MPEASPLPIEAALGPLNDVERKYAPKVLYLAGDTSLLKSVFRVAIVGSRQASELGLKRAARLARVLAERDICVVSGLAEGIDTAAHRGSIGHGGRTIAVIGTPLERAYPRMNRALQEEIARDHLLVTEFAAGRPVERKNFVLRNRTMALISHASVIVEAGEGSGSLSQGWEAIRLGRPLFVMSSLLERDTLKWPHEMIDYGAMVLREPDDLFGALPPEPFFDPANAPF